jgi:ABC-type glycerol-3-phosphate transport system substrate-binding protein
MQIWLRGFGAHMVDPDDPDVSGLCTPEALECLETARAMIHEEHSFAYGAETAGQSLEILFNNAAIGVMEVGSWMLRPLVTGSWTSDEGGDDWLDFRWDVAPYWAGPGGITTHQSVDGQSCWSAGKNPDMAWELCKFVASADFETLNQTLGEGVQPSRKSVMPIWAAERRKKWPILEQVNLEVFVEGMEKNYGAPEEMFAKNDYAAKHQILKPAFDQVTLENTAPVQLICEYSKVIGKLNKGEIGIENIGAEMEKIKL